MIRELLAFVAPSFVPSEPHHINVDPPASLSFSAAILRGCAVTVGDPFSYLVGDRACVMGAAVRAAGWTKRTWNPMCDQHREFYEKHFGRYGTMHDIYRAKWGRGFEADFSTGVQREVIAMRFQALGQ